MAITEEICFIKRYIDFQFYPCTTCKQNVKWEKLSKIIMLKHLYRKFKNYNIPEIVVNYAQTNNNFCSDRCMDIYKNKIIDDFIICYSCRKKTRLERSFTLNMLTDEGKIYRRCLKCVKYDYPKPQTILLPKIQVPNVFRIQ